MKHPMSRNVSGDKNPNYKGGLWKICPICGNKKDFNAKTCSECYTKLGRKGNRNKYFGEENSNYKGGISPVYNLIRSSVKYSEWRVLIFQRDFFICQACKKNSEGDLNAHHIKLFHQILEENEIKTIEQALQCDELWDISNGITLCEDCHNQIHNKEK